MIARSPIDLLFADAFFEVPDILPGSTLLLKLEGFNLTGSIKFKPALERVEAPERVGKLRPVSSRRMPPPFCEIALASLHEDVACSITIPARGAAASASRG